MPLPSDENVLALAEALLGQFDAMFGLHAGFRPVHAKGVMVTGTFIPSRDAMSLTRAPHAERSETPVVVRFSNSTGIPVMPDNDSNAIPHGMAIRFQLGEHVHTDIVSHSTNGFPAKNGDEFLAFLRAAASPPQPSPTPIEVFLGSHPAALAFVQPRPSPSSFATEAYFPVAAFEFTNRDGVRRYGRYRIVPEGGVEHLDAAALKGKGDNFLFDELPKRIAAGPVGFKILVQLAKEGDVVDDATVSWPEDRPLLEFGKLTLTAMVPDNAHAQKTIIFDPVPRADGIEPSADPLFELRAAIYLMSGRRRRRAP